MLAFAAALAMVAGFSDPPPNVVIILMDDVGRDKIGAYGDHPSPAVTPNLDALAAQGVLFRGAWTYPVCSPTRAALLTGRLAERTGIGTIVSASDGVQTPLPLSEITLPEALPRHECFSFGKWHLSDTQPPPGHELSHGFDTAVGFVGKEKYFRWDEHVNGVVRPERGYYPTALARRGIRLLESRTDPFFVYYCPVLAHSPFHAPPQQLHTQGSPTFAPFQHLAMVEAFDTLFGHMMASIDLSNTYVIVLGDNGSPSVTIRAPWPFAHGKRSPYEGGLNVPLIVAGPGVAAGAECNALVHVTDLFATVLELVGEPPLTTGADDSISFAPLLTNPAAPGERDTLYIRQFPFPGATSNVVEFSAIRTQRWKLIERTDMQRYELYDLDADPLETNDLLVSNPGPTTDALRDRLIAAMPTFP